MKEGTTASVLPAGVSTSILEPLLHTEQGERQDRGWVLYGLTEESPECLLWDTGPGTGFREAKWIASMN